MRKLTLECDGGCGHHEKISQADWDSSSMPLDCECGQFTGWMVVSSQVHKDYHVKGIHPMSTLKAHITKRTAN
jgi:hypothetical protein